jgi:hypothetical protein
LVLNQKFIMLDYTVTLQDWWSVLRMVSTEIVVWPQSSWFSWCTGFWVTYEVTLGARYRRSPLGGASTTGSVLDIIKSSVGCWKELDEPLCTESLDSCLVIFTGVLGSDPTVGKIEFQFKILSNFQQSVVFMNV